MVRDNCYNNTETIDVSLKLFAFPTDTPLYVASYWDDVDPDRAKTVGRLGWGAAAAPAGDMAKGRAPEAGGRTAAIETIRFFWR